MASAPTPNAAQPTSRRRWYQFTLPALLIFVTLAGCGFGWLGFKIRDARQQEAAVAAIEKMGRNVEYDCTRDEIPGPTWLHSLFGDDLFRSVEAVFLDGGKYGELSPLNDINDADLKLLDGFSKLKRLSLDNTQVTDAGLVHLEPLTQLEELNLDGTKVTDGGLAGLERLPHLNYLNLDYTTVTDAGLQRLAGLAQLRVLCLYGSHVTVAGVARLQKSLPKCDITR